MVKALICFHRHSEAVCCRCGDFQTDIPHEKVKTCGLPLLWPVLSVALYDSVLGCFHGHLLNPSSAHFSQTLPQLFIYSFVSDPFTLNGKRAGWEAHHQAHWPFRNRRGQTCRSFLWVRPQFRFYDSCYALNNYVRKQSDLPMEHGSLPLKWWKTSTLLSTRVNAFAISPDLTILAQFKRDFPSWLCIRKD